MSGMLPSGSAVGDDYEDKCLGCWYVGAALRAHSGDQYLECFHLRVALRDDSGDHNPQVRIQVDRFNTIYNTNEPTYRNKRQSHAPR